MKLNNKGFAITSIIYSMLILFLVLVLLIMGNLASRKAVFDKQKNELLDKINQVEPGDEIPDDDVIICTLSSDIGDTGISYGDVYSCDPGDETARTFYVLEDGDTTTLTDETGRMAQAGEVSLIMDSNIDDTDVAWSESGDPLDTTALNYLKSKTSNWTVEVNMPTSEQINNVGEGGGISNVEWLITNLDKASSNSFGAYWTATYYYVDSSDYYRAYFVTKYESSFSATGYYATKGSSNITEVSAGVRPVITIPKDQLS